MGILLSVARARRWHRSLLSTEGLVVGQSWEILEPVPGECPCSHNGPGALYNFDCNYGQYEDFYLEYINSLIEMEHTYHWGKVSSQRMCLFLQVLHPFRLLVWLRLEGPPPGPAIAMKRLVGV